MSYQLGPVEGYGFLKHFDDEQKAKDYFEKLRVYGEKQDFHGQVHLADDRKKESKIYDWDPENKEYSLLNWKYNESCSKKKQ